MSNDTSHSRLNYRQATYMLSVPKLSLCPKDVGLEVAFAGRSNAGKSSALNALTGDSKLARVSKTPGRTQLINFFALSEEHRLVDLPGYGYAKVPEKMKLEWQRHLDEYLSGRESLCGLVLMMDIRHPLKEFDMTMLNWANSSGLPLHILLTKADKLKFGAAKKTLLEVQKKLKSMPLVTAQLFSAPKGTGVDVLQKHLNKWYFPDVVHQEPGAEA